MADATVEAYTEALDEAVDVNVAVAAAEEEVRTLGFRSIVATGFQISDETGFGIWHFGFGLILVDRPPSHWSLCTQSPED